MSKRKQHAKARNTKPRGRIFIGHTNRVARDKDYSLRLYHALKYLEFSVFLDNEHAWKGQLAATVISTRMAQSDYYVPVLSLQSLERPWFRYELNQGISFFLRDTDRRRPVIIPLYLEDFRKPVDELASFDGVWASSRTFAQVLKEILKQGMGLHLSTRLIDNAAGVYDPHKPNWVPWLTALVPNHQGHPFIVTRDEKRNLKKSCNDAMLKDELTFRLEQFLLIKSLAEIVVHDLQDRIETELVQMSRGSREQMLRLGYLLFRNAARRWAQGDPEKMITRDDWEAVKRKVPR